jgi:hypothetical protein
MRGLFTTLVQKGWDTLAAFATVMLGVSLLITVLDQMIAGLLGHRAMYLKDGNQGLAGNA